MAAACKKQAGIAPSTAARLHCGGDMSSRAALFIPPGFPSRPPSPCDIHIDPRARRRSKYAEPGIGRRRLRRRVLRML